MPCTTACCRDRFKRHQCNDKASRNASQLLQKLDSPSRRACLSRLAAKYSSSSRARTSSSSICCPRRRSTCSRNWETSSDMARGIWQHDTAFFLLFLGGGKERQGKGEDLNLDNSKQEIDRKTPVWLVAAPRVSTSARRGFSWNIGLIKDNKKSSRVCMDGDSIRTRMG